MCYRENHILDLVFSTHPDVISEPVIVLGISHHEAIFFKIKLSSRNPLHSRLRKIYQLYNANTDGILEDMNQFTRAFVSAELS